jgi:hypothetical protein
MAGLVPTITSCLMLQKEKTWMPATSAGMTKAVDAEKLADFVLGVLAGVGLTGRPAIHALRILRALVRGFVLHEMTSSFLEPLDYDETFGAAVEVYIRGLSALQTGTV